MVFIQSESFVFKNIFGIYSVRERQFAEGLPVPIELITID